MRVRHFFLITAFACVILAPLSAQISGFDPGRPLEENRVLAKPVALPETWSETVQVPAKADDYLRDNFGLRRFALETYDELVWDVLRQSPSVQLTRGKHGMIFFNSHSAKYPYSLIAESCGIGWTDASFALLTDQIANLLQQVRRINAASSLVIVPTKAVVYPENLPRWLGELCQRATPPMRGVARRLTADAELAALFDYGLDETRALKSKMTVYEPTAFHWTGNFPRYFAERISEKTFGLTRMRSFKTQAVVIHSDLQRFMPGIDLWMTDVRPDYASSGVRECVGPACFPEFDDIAKRLVDVRRFKAAQEPSRRLLLISDSFGAGIAGWFSEYFSEVWHLNINYIMNRETPPVDEAQLRELIFFTYRPQYIVYLFHDGALQAPAELPRLFPDIR